MLPRSAPCGFKASQTLGAKCRAHVPASWRFLLMAAPRGRAVLLPVPTSLPSRWKGRLGWDPLRLRVPPLPSDPRYLLAASCRAGLPAAERGTVRRRALRELPSPEDRQISHAF